LLALGLRTLCVWRRLIIYVAIALEENTFVVPNAWHVATSYSGI